MNRSKKRGITLAALIIYLALFTGFTVFVSAMSSDMNERLFDYRGEAINYSDLNKLQYNIENSAIQSTDVDIYPNQISYSNGDTYIYDNNAKVIYKNGGILCQDVAAFTVNLEVGENVKKITINTTFMKYLNKLERTIVSCVEAM